MSSEDQTTIRDIDEETVVQVVGVLKSAAAKLKHGMDQGPGYEVINAGTK